MKLCCIGCGPGDPKLITLKAFELIKNADVIFVPTSKRDKNSIVLSIVQKYIDEKDIIILPDIEDLFTKDKINSFKTKKHFEKFILSLQTTETYQYSQN